MRDLFQAVDGVARSSCEPCAAFNSVDVATIAVAKRFGPGETAVHLVPLLGLLIAASVPPEPSDECIAQNVTDLAIRMSQIGIDLDDYSATPGRHVAVLTLSSVAKVLAETTPYAFDWESLGDERRNWFTMAATKLHDLGYRITKIG